MLPIGFAPAIPESRPPALLPAAAVAQARDARRDERATVRVRRVAATAEPAERVHAMHVFPGMLIDMFA